MPPSIVKDMAAVASMSEEKIGGILFASKHPIGEAPKKGKNYPRMTADQRRAMEGRLRRGVGLLMDEAAADHLANCKTPGTDTVNPDYVTRLSTNEFFFYTQEPLTLAEFEQLQNDIAKKAKLMPPGVQLVLGSFAVLTPDNRVMNVTPHITCGASPPQPSFQLIVKNHTSAIDVRYKNKASLGGFDSLKVFDVTSAAPGTSDIPIPITIDGKKQNFTFNNVVPCSTPGGTPFLTVVEICLDHRYETGQLHLNEYLKKLLKEDPDCLISHVIISNTIEKIAAHCLGAVMHVDPVWSAKKCKKNVKQITREAANDEHYFGNSTVKFYLLTAEPCQSLKEVTLFKELERLLALLKTFKFGDPDPEMERFIEEKRLAIENAKSSLEVLPLLSELVKTTSSLETNSAVKDVRATIADLRHKSEAMFSSGKSKNKMKSQANQLEKLMGTIPIGERCNFPQSKSSEDILKVINDIAPHLHLEYKESKENKIPPLGF